jgi:hypothetical protein
VSAALARDTQPVVPVRLATCDRCGERALTQTVNDAHATRWCLDCIALPPAPRALPEPAAPQEVARGSRP